MSFRQPKSHRDAEQRAWQAWLARHEPAIKATGLPPSVTLSESHWTDFLQNGYLEWHPESQDGFVFDQLSRDQMSRLLAVLEASPEYAAEPMSGWLRYRLGQPAAG
jgi:hypothetical protein